MKWTIYWNYSTQNIMMILWCVDLQILHVWLVFVPTSKKITVSTVLFHEYGGENVAVKNYMSHFSMLVPTKATVKLDNGNTWHAQGFGIILCHFTNYTIIYPMGTVHHCPSHLSNTISSDAIKLFVGFQKVASEPLEHCDFSTLKVVLGYHSTILKII